MTTPLIEHQRAHLRKALAKLSTDQRRRLLQQMVPRMPQGYVPHTPHPTQQVFLKLRNLEAFFGGAGGGGKSDALLMGALQYVDVPGYSALILRRTYADLVLPGAIMDRAATWLRPTDAKPIDGGVSWKFPGGGRITFGYLQRDNDKYRYASAEFQYIAFDELTHFPSENTYSFLFSRLRKPQLRCLVCGVKILRRPEGYVDNKGLWKHDNTNSSRRSREGKQVCFEPLPDMEAVSEYLPSKADGVTLFDVPLRMRSASNPGGVGAEWVRERFVDPEKRKPGVAFVPSLLADNPSLNADDYKESLEHLSIVDRERMLNGDWDIQESGDFFERGWWNYEVDPPKGHMVRHWDMAATADGGDYTVGTLQSRVNGKTYIIDVVRGQWSPAKTEEIIKATAQADGRGCWITMEQEPGSAGAAVVDHYSRTVLADFPFEAQRPTGSKLARAKPFAITAERGNVFLKVGAPWLRDWLNEMTAFPTGAHDDQVDSVSGGYNFLSEVMGSSIIV